MVHHFRAQMAVGQGGFHGAMVRDGTDSVRWIYDFGTSTASQKLNLKNAFNRWQEYCHVDDSIDVLFISHFDEDHLNGLQLLNNLKSDRVKKIVFPLYNDDEKMALIFNLSSSNMINAELCKLIIDPIAWVRNRFKRAEVIMVIPSDFGEGVTNERDQTPSRSNKVGVKWEDLNANGNLNVCRDYNTPFGEYHIKTIFVSRQMFNAV